MTARAFTWQEIESDWLAGGTLALSNDEVVDAFNRVMTTFGRGWVEASRTRNGTVSRGTSATLHVATLGRLLESVDGVPNTEHLLDKVREELPDARAELVAIHLVRSGASVIELEVEREVAVGERTRMPDFQVRRPGEDWTYVEVTQPSTSPAQADVLRGLDRLTRLAEICEGSFALEVFFRRDPTANEIEAVATEIVQRHETAGTEQVELADGLGTLYWNATEPGQVTLEDHGTPPTPRLGQTLAAMGDGVHRHITVRWPFTDVRAKKFLRAEARQLPTEAPGLIMIQTSIAVGAMKTWRSLIERLFQPTVYTRVSAVCLFSSGTWPTEQGDEWQPQTKLIVNPHARFALPRWIGEQLERFPSSGEIFEA